MATSKRVSVNSDIIEAHDFEGYTVLVRADSIFQVNYKPGFIGNVDDLKQQVNLLRRLSPEKKCLLLAMLQEDNLFTRESREYMASSEVVTVIKADALVIKGLALKIFMKGYLAIDKPKRPIRLFNSKQPAVKWLMSFVDKP